VEEYSGYVGLDVHKDTIAVAIAYPGRSKAKSLGIIATSRKRNRCRKSISAITT
jgi:hypothetical protein